MMPLPAPALRLRARRADDRRGTILIVVLGVMTVLAVVGSSFALMMKTELRAATAHVLAETADSIAQSGLQRAIRRIGHEMRQRPYSELDETLHFGAIRLRTGGTHTSYRGETRTYDTFGGARDFRADGTPPSLPYTKIDSGRAYVDVDANGNFTESIDEALIEPDEDNPVFYQPARGNTPGRALFSGFPHAGVFRGDTNKYGGDRIPGGSRYKIKAIPTNAQLNLNGLQSTLLDFLADDQDGLEDGFQGSQFKFMLRFLGRGIYFEHGESGDLRGNPLTADVVNDIYQLREEYGGWFTNKDQVVDVMPEGNAAWRFVQDYVTVHAWPAHDPLTGLQQPNTMRPSVSLQSYQDKIGYYDEQRAANSKVGDPLSVTLIPVTLAPIDVNTAPAPVLYAAIGGVSGDARWYYYSRTALKVHDGISGPAAPIISSLVLKRPNTAPGGEDKQWVTPDEQKFYPEAFADIESSYAEVREIDSRTMRPGRKLFRRAIHQLHWIRIDPFMPDDFANDTPSEGNDYAYNMARAIEALRPFHGWADFEERVIRDLIEAKGPTSDRDNRGRINNRRVGGGSVPICRPFRDFEHPWNPQSPGGNPDMREIADEFETWYYEAVGDLMRAAFCPTPRFNKFNPDANYYTKIDSTDLVYWTVPFMFTPPPIWEVTSTGEVLDTVYDPLANPPRHLIQPVAQKTIRSIVRVGDKVRHHTMKDFAVGFPASPKGFGDPDRDPGITPFSQADVGDPDRVFSQVRLFADVFNIDQSRTALFPYPLNKTDRVMRVRNFHPPTEIPDELEDRVYAPKGISGADLRLHGMSTVDYTFNQAIPGYVSVQPQDHSPFDYEFRAQSGGDAGDGTGAVQLRLLGTPGDGQVTAPSIPKRLPETELRGLLPRLSNESIGTAPPSEVEKSPTGYHLLFFAPFNETLSTGFPLTAGDSISVDRSFASATIPTQVQNEVQHFTRYRWTPYGFTSRVFDFDGPDKDSQIAYPIYLTYPAGPRSENARNDMQGRTFDQIIEELPDDDLMDQIQNWESWREIQDLLQIETNFPYYHGTVEFWFKSDIDQWDMAPGDELPGSDDEIDNSGDRITCGFFGATNLTYRDPAAGEGIIGVQTFFWRLPGNYLAVARLHFMDALYVQSGSIRTAELATWVSGGRGDRKPFTKWLIDKCDPVLNLSWDAYEGMTPPPDPEWRATPDTLDEGDYGFMYSVVLHFVPLDPLYNNVEGRGLLWRPHEWYHMAVSFRSDAETHNVDNARSGHSKAVDFYINGVWLDTPQLITAETENSTNWNFSTLARNDAMNDRSLMPNVPSEQTGRNYMVRVWSSFINDINPRSLLTVGAVTRRQATLKQIEEYNARPSVSVTNLRVEQEMFYFADGTFVLPANGTIDAFRVTNKWLELDRDAFGPYTEGELERIRAFARYNTDPGNPDVTILGTYQNGFRNVWGTDVLLASFNWIEHRPRWDSARSRPVLFRQAPYIQFQLATYRPDDGGLELKSRVDSAFRIANFTADPETGAPIQAVEDVGRIKAMGVAFPDDEILPTGGCFVYTAIFNNAPFFILNSAPILDEVSLTVLTGSEVLATDVIYN
jgi:hypothetical protein